MKPLRIALTKGRLEKTTVELLEKIEKLTPVLFKEIKNDEKVMCANVDMYSGLVYKMLGIPSDLFTPLFAVSRMAGWCAHRFEEINSGKRIIRPKPPRRRVPPLPAYMWRQECV